MIFSLKTFITIIKKYMNNTTSIFCFTHYNFIDFWIFLKKLRITVSADRIYSNFKISLFQIDENDQKFCDDAKEEKSNEQIVIYLK